MRVSFFEPYPLFLRGENSTGRLTPVNSYEFGVFQPGSYQKEPQHCRTQVLGLANADLPEVGPWEGKCEETSKTFSVARTADGGLTLTVSQPVSPISNTTGTYTIPAAELEHQQSGASIREVYIGPTSFDLEFQ